MTAKRTLDGQTVTVAVLAVESGGLSWQEPGVKQPIEIKEGQAVIGVDVIASKQINYRMVEVKADDMATALVAEGKVDLYGILFDIDKAASSYQLVIRRDALLIVKPETVLRWHRAGWRAYWRGPSRRKGIGGRHPIPAEVRALIRRMASENHLWGQRRIQAELLRLGLKLLSSFCRNEVSDQCLTASGRARLRMKVARS